MTTKRRFGTIGVRTVQVALGFGAVVAIVGWLVTASSTSAMQSGLNGSDSNDTSPGLDPHPVCVNEDPLSDCPAGDIIPNKSLFITDLCVVEDPCRTSWNAPALCSADSNGAWTFGALMAAIAGFPHIDYDPQGLSDFVEKWMSQFANDTVVENGITVSAREFMHQRIMDPWWALSEQAGLDHLDMRLAPFRLLAIVNRVDLRGPEPGPYGGSTAGEGRFIFSFLDINSTFPPVADPDQWSHLFFPGRGTIIFEYHLPAQNCHDVLEWGRRWHDLSSIPFGATFNAELQKITDDFAGFGAGGPSAPNYSALAQVRTNEVLNGFGTGSPWELREFQLVGSGVGVPLTQTTVAQTVDINFNDPPPGGLLERYLIEDQLAIINNQHVIPLFFGPSNTPFRAGSSLNPTSGQPGGGSNFVWLVEPFNCTETRHNFAILNCNGCHAAEAGLFDCNGPQAHATNFTHVAGREIGERAGLSRFLTGDPNGVEDMTCPPSPAPNSHNCFPPAGSVNHGATIRYMNDLQRRSLDLCNLVSSSCEIIVTHEMSLDELSAGHGEMEEVHIHDVFDSSHLAGNRVH